MTTAATPTFVPFVRSWDAPQLKDEELARPHAFEWWYFDLSTEGGVELVIIFGRRNPIWSSPRATMYVEYKDPQRKFDRIRNIDRKQFTWRDDGDACELRIGENSFRISGREPEELRYDLSLALPWLSGSLVMKPLHQGFLPTPDGVYFRHQTDAARYSSVSFSAPLMSVQGTLTVDGKRLDVSGTGYHDHPWGTELFFWTHAEWHWARAATADEDVMFATVSPQTGYTGALKFLFAGERGVFEPSIAADLAVTPSAWSKDKLMGINHPHHLEVAAMGRSWSSDAQRSLLDTPYYNRSAVTWRRAGGAPGAGWTEYWRMRASRASLVFWMARLSAFFWRRFPWFGQ